MSLTMPKITVILDEQLNTRLRQYIYDNTPPPETQYGKLKEIVEEALDNLEDAIRKMFDL